MMLDADQSAAQQSRTRSSTRPHDAAKVGCDSMHTFGVSKLLLIISLLVSLRATLLNAQHIVSTCLLPGSRPLSDLTRA